MLHQVISLSMIPCVQNCLYQTDGLCTLSHAIQASGTDIPQNACLHFKPHPALSDENRQRLTDIGHTYQL